MSQNLDMNAAGESDGRVVPAKCPNKGGSLSPEEGMEGRRPTKENTGQLAASQMQSWGNALAGLRRVREAAKREKRLRFTALLHHVSVALLTNSFYALKREAAGGFAQSRAPGHVSGVTFQESLYSQARWTAAAPGHSRPGGQNRPTRYRNGPQPDLRGGLSGFLVRIPARAQRAQRVRCALGRDHEEEGELGAGCRHS